MKWYVYMLRCADNTFYTGITTEPQRRLAEHNGEVGTEKGAKYTRTRRPLVLVYKKRCTDRSTACKEEWRIRRLTRAKKEALLKK